MTIAQFRVGCLWAPPRGLAGLRFGVPCITTVRAAQAVVAALAAVRADDMEAISLQALAARA